MTNQECNWKWHEVIVTGCISKSGKYHHYVRNLAGRRGTVLGESKNNMLLVQFKRMRNGVYHGQFTRAIPAGCLTRVDQLKTAGT